MKRKIFSFALMAAFVGSMAMSCSSAKKAGAADSASSDSAKMKAPMDTASSGSSSDTAKAKMDTTKKDTVKKP